MTEPDAYIRILDWKADGLSELIYSALSSADIIPQNTTLARVYSAKIDLDMMSDHFLSNIDSYLIAGVDFLYSKRQLPKSFRVESLSDESRANVYRHLGIIYEFHCPHKYDAVMIESPYIEFLENIVAVLSA